MPYIRRYRPNYRPNYRPLYRSRYTPRFRQLFEGKWDALIARRRQQRRQYTPEELRARIAQIEARRRREGRG